MTSTSSGSIASKIPFKDLCRRCEKISTIAREKKVEYFNAYVNWFREFANKHALTDPSVDVSFYPILRLILPQLDRERGPYGIKEHTLAKVYIRILCLPKEGQDASKLMNYKAPRSTGSQAGDFAEVAFWVLRNRCSEGGTLTIEDVNVHLDNIASKNGANDPRGVDTELMLMLRTMSAEEQKWLIRILLKDMKLGLGQSKILTSFHSDAQELYDVTNNLVKVCEQLKDPSVRLNEIEVSLFSPFRAMLSEKCDVSVVENSMKRGHFYYVETKHDGERFQLHMSKGEYKYFSKNGFEYTNTYGGSAMEGVLTPHLARLFRSDVHSCILDGEMMAWNSQLGCYRSKGLHFDVKSLKPGDMHRPCFCVFDILMLNDQVLSNKRLEDRYKYLDDLFKPSEGILALTERRKVTKKEEIIEELNLAIDSRLEGIMLKDPSSVYKPNTRKGGWFKIKPEYTDGLMDHLDVIIIGGYFGQGRRSGVVSHFLVAVAVPPTDGSSKPTVFHSIGRVGSGYSMSELEELLKKLSPYWKPVKVGECPSGLEWTREKPDVWISPQNSYILEIKASEICASNMFKTGFTLRFPRVEKIRDDKCWYECMTTTEFEQLRLEASGKLSSRHATMDTTLSEPLTKKARQTNRIIPSLGEQFRSADVSEIISTSKLLENKEFCVLTGSKELTKQQIETKIVEHGGSVVQNMSPSTFCALASDETLRVRNVIKCGLYDVAQIDWMLGVLARGIVPDWSLPDLMSASPATAKKLRKRFDQFGDSYTEDATQETIGYVLSQVKKTRSDSSIDQKDVADLDIELFSGPSPYGIFRLCYAYFDKTGLLENVAKSFELAALEFRFYGGIRTDTIDERTTHVILHSGSHERLNEIKEINRQHITKFYVVNEKWIEDSVREGAKQNERTSYASS